MQSTATRSSSPTFYTAISAFFVIVLLIIGSVFFVHEKKKQEQRALYKDYIAWNAWRVPSQTTYAKMKPHLDVLQSIKFSDQKDLKRADDAYAELMKLKKVFDAIPRVTTLPAKRVEREWKELFREYEAVKWNTTFIWEFHRLPDNRNHAHTMVARDLAFREGSMYPDASVAQVEKILKDNQKRVAAWSDDAVRNALIDAAQNRSVFRQLKIDRRLYEEHLAAPEVIPAGLDFDFVRRYRL